MKDKENPLEFLAEQENYCILRKEQYITLEKNLFEI